VRAGRAWVWQGTVVACLALAWGACAGSSASNSSDEGAGAASAAGVRRLERTLVTEDGRVLTRVVVTDGAPYRLPHQPAFLLSDYWDCRGRRRHRGLDLASDAPEAGLGRPVVAIGRSRVVEIGTPELDAERYGRRLTANSMVERGGLALPASAEIQPYGRVFFFTENYGRAHTGVIVVTELLDGPLAGHRVRYMHLGAVHPGLEVGALLEMGEELGLMGGTAILSSVPHVHLDVEDAQGRRVDPSGYLGLPVGSRDGAPDC
jgi:murein DD-endopeptidase MepM/ murein hydrolase activator NlpD